MKPRVTALGAFLTTKWPVETAERAGLTTAGGRETAKPQFGMFPNEFGTFLRIFRETGPIRQSPERIPEEAEQTPGLYAS